MFNVNQFPFSRLQFDAKVITKYSNHFGTVNVDCKHVKLTTFLKDYICVMMITLFTMGNCLPRSVLRTNSIYIHSCYLPNVFFYMDGWKNVFPIMSKTSDHSIYRPRTGLSVWTGQNHGWVIQSNGVTSGQNSYK